MKGAALAAAGCLLLAAIPLAAWPAGLTVRLDHLRPGAAVQVALYRDAASWARQRGALMQRRLLAQAPVARVRFDKLPPGRYAVSAMQDAGHGVFEPLPLTLARYGDSGQGNALLHASFEQAALDLAGEDVSVPLHLFSDGCD